MARTTDRPFAGNWEPNLRKIVRHTPDALVYINGDTGIPGCGSCGGRVDIQPFITGVSCEPSTNPMATATLSLSIPKYLSSGLFRDGKFALRPGLEVHVYYRGYFPASNILNTSDGTNTNASLNEVMYPYYLVFHGVVTNSSYSYAGGEYSATVSCTDLLHFWQYQRMVEQGSILANRPSGSKVQSSWLGHNFSGMSPYAIVYNLYRDVFGAAGGVETNWLDANATNSSAVSSQTGESLFSLTILYWQKRFSTTVANLRMFGADGKVYNAFQAAFIGTLTTDQAAELATYYSSASSRGNTKDPSNATARLARAVGYDPFSVYTTGGSSGTDSKDSLGINVAALQSYVSDISKWGSMNLLETAYLTKMEIANEVVKETGFEFFQDVDGDIVFKPPFYNMDTSGLRVYRLEPEDIISFDVTEKEPECTVIKWTGGHFSDLKVPTLEGEFGKRAEFIDYRLVAQFGWRQETFDSAYYADERAAYYAAISRMDLYNIAVRSASATIPLRPELRPGYPVYVVHVDCFYYVTGISHTFSFGGSCTSALTLVGRRSKFHAPGSPPEDGRLATVNDVHMDNMHLPSLPLTLPAGAVTGTSVSYATGVPGGSSATTSYVDVNRKTQGFPNVVMAIDPQLVNPLQFARGFDLDSLTTSTGIRNLIKTVVMGHSAVLQRAPSATPADEKKLSFEGPWQIQVSNEEWQPLPSVDELVAIAQRLQAAGKTVGTAVSAQREAANAAATAKKADKKAKQAEAKKAATATDTADVSLESAVEEANKLFGVLVEAARSVYEKAFPGSGTTAAALELVSDYKSTYTVGKTIPGYYRYYSSAHPDPANQGMLKFSLDAAGQPSTAGGLHTMPRTKATQFARDGSGFTEGTVSAGIPIATAGNGMQVRATHEIRSFDIAKLEVTVVKGRVLQSGQRVQAFPEQDLAGALQRYFVERIRFDTENLGQATNVSTAFTALFEKERDRIAAIVGDPAQVPAPADVPEGSSVTSVPNGIFSLDVLVNATGKSESVTSGFTLEDRRVVFDDGTEQNRKHTGTDLRAAVGTPVTSPASGTVVLAINDRGNQGRDANGNAQYGNYIDVSHAGGYKSRYAHLSAVNVTVGQTVNAGQQIALSGQSGGVAPHLHFGLYLNDVPVDSSLYQLAGDTFAPKDAALALPVVTPPVATSAGNATAAAATASTTYNATAAESVKSALLPGYATLGDVPGNDITSQIGNLAMQMADAIAGPATTAMSEVANSTASGDASKYAAAWAEMFPEGTTFLPSVRDAAGKKVNNDASSSYYAPVYPVSDERGYEVVGTYAYGRGLNLSSDTFGQLFGPTNQLTSYDKVDAFINKLRTSGATTADVAKGVGTLDLSEAAELASRMDPSLRAGVTEVLSDGSLQKPGFTGAGTNTPASTAQGIGVFSPLNVAYGLADMKVATKFSVCDCFAHQTDIQLLRSFGTGDPYIVIEGTEEAFTAYAQGVAASKVPDWAATQTAYRGEILARGGQGSVATIIAAGVNAVAGFNAATANLNQAASNVDQAVADLRGIDRADAFVDPNSAFSASVTGDWDTAWARTSDTAATAANTLKNDFLKGDS